MTPAPVANFAVVMRLGDPRPFDNVVSGKRFLDHTDDALRLVRLRDGVVMAYKSKVSDAALSEMARLFRKHD